MIFRDLMAISDWLLAALFLATVVMGGTKTKDGKKVGVWVAVLLVLSGIGLWSAL